VLFLWDSCSRLGLARKAWLATKVFKEDMILFSSFVKRLKQ
jgi:hypothetical protein